ncbi:MAG: ABC transporter ATP-binding protein [Kiloniellales bacterium]|nr:ABC transporter ATP-binding protein [Kiloniellales bacterium]
MGQLSSSTSPDIEFDQVTKRFGDVLAVDRVSLRVDKGEFFSFLGPSGCGKTTSLRLIAGFEQPSEGNVFIGGVSVVGIPPHKRPVNMVFQHYALFPHMTVAQNIGYGLRQQRPQPPKAEISKRVEETLEMVQMSGFGERRIWELSGGQQQRVALARALINRPTVLLLDEPIAALDHKLRRDMQIELQTLQRDVGITFILVTHDQEEALSMSDRICIMREGQVVQLGGPRDLYDRPINRYVADFVGKSNFFPGTVSSVNGRSVTIESEGGLAFCCNPGSGSGGLSIGGAASIAVRPELIVIGPENSGASDMGTDVTLAGKIKNRIFLGEHTEYLVSTPAHGDVLVLSPKHIESIRGSFDPGQEVTIGWKNETALALEDS